MLPNLVLLKHPSAAGGEAAVPNLAAHEPPLSPDGSPVLPRTKRGRRPPPPLVEPAPAAPAAHAPFPEEDDLSTDDEVQKNSELCQADNALLEQMLSRDWLVNARDTIDEDTLRMMGHALALDEPPHRHLFSCLGEGAPIHHVRLGRDSVLATNAGAVPMNAFDALLALRTEFANKPTNWDAVRGCGAANCFRDGVDIHGTEPWQLALRAIMLAGADKRQALPNTVAVRAPKAMRAPKTEAGEKASFDWAETADARKELRLTLRAAQMGIAPPVYATFPVKVVYEKSGTLGSRQYGYICEDGWKDLFVVLTNLRLVHNADDERERAERSIATSVASLLHKVSHAAQYLMLDTKTPNMVARRAAGTTTYEVLAIDFGALMTTDTMLHGNTQRMNSECIFFVNSLLFLNFVMRVHKKQMAIFRDLAMEVAQTWRKMERNDDGFCALLSKDASRVAGEKNGNIFGAGSGPESAFLATLRLDFYTTLEVYGDEKVPLPEIDQSARRNSGFIDRYLQLLEEKFERPRS